MHSPAHDVPGANNVSNLREHSSAIDWTTIAEGWQYFTVILAGLASGRLPQG